MKKAFLFFQFGIAFTLAAAAAEPVVVAQLICEHSVNPIGIGVVKPRLSWKLSSVQQGERQTAYEIRAASSEALLHSGRPDLWNSGKVNSGQSVLVTWNGQPLASRSEVFWQVRVWDKGGQPSAWSEVASFELGLLNPASEWKAHWITADLPRYDIEAVALKNASWISAGSIASQAAAVRLVVVLPTNQPPRVFPSASPVGRESAGLKASSEFSAASKSTTTPNEIRRAVIDATGDGFVTIYVNGHAHEHGKTSRTAPVHADVREELVPGRNVIAIGSEAVRNAIRHDRGQPGRNAIAAHGFIEFENGQQIQFNTDSKWKAAVNPPHNWSGPDFDDSKWPDATVLGSYSSAPSKYCDNTIGPGRYLRRNFFVGHDVVRVRLYATALGVYEASINGHRIGNQLLSPGWTDYNKRVMVQTYDITELLSRGTNAIGLVLADGWYAGRVGWMGLAQYGTRPACAAQLEITYANGSRQTIATDSSWKAGPGEILGADLQWGEIIDARKAVGNWNERSFDDSKWASADDVNAWDNGSTGVSPRVVCQTGPPVQELFEVPPQRVTRRGNKWIVDFGQNMVGCVRLSAHGPASTTITVRHGEMLNQDGSLYTENLRTALATDKFILKGAPGRETFQPRFTFHGFRYAEISGYRGELRADDIRGIVIGSNTPGIGTWESSNPQLNRLYENIVWSQQGNFLSIPTDCPQRDERMGWMGDAQVFAPTAARNANVAGFFDKWMADVDDGQGTNGDFANCSPRVADPHPAWPVWGDAGVIVPWTMYQQYGDPGFLADNYSNMVRWVDFNVRRSHGLILNGGVGDHLAPRRTPVQVVDTACFANSARIVSEAAAVLGKTGDAEKYKKLHEQIVQAFDQEFVSTNGIVQGDTQTAYILALQFNLLPQNQRATAANRLAEKVESAGHLTTGFVGVGLICPTLTEIHRSDLAWKLLLTDTYPSWLFSVKNGATTIWERWDGWTPEHGFQDASMNSFNHYSLGSVGAWLYSGAAGIQSDDSAPGYKHFFLRPQITPRVAWVKATLDSPCGQITSFWRTEKNKTIYDATVPPNSTATLEIPGAPEKLLAAGKHHFEFPVGAPK